MDNNVEIIIVYNDYSVADNYREKYDRDPLHNKYRNAKLHKKGILLAKLLNIDNYIENIDYIFTSPLNRAIETSLILCNKNLEKKIYLVPLLCDINNNLIENKGDNINITKNDDNLKIYKNFNKIDFNINSGRALYLYNYGWRLLYDKNEYDFPDIIETHLHDWIELQQQIFIDPEYRKKIFMKLLSNNIFTKKKILMFSHKEFIDTILGISVNNLGILSFKFNQNTCKFFDIKQEAKYELYLNYMSYIDTLGLNNATIYKQIYDNYEFNVIRLTPEKILYRGFINRKCIDVSIIPGTDNDTYRYEPIWFGPPEVAVLYCVKNISNIILRRISDNPPSDLNISDYSDNNIYKLCILTLKNNISSNIAYKIKKPCELIDINNINNIKNILLLFRQNFTYENFMKLYELNRITLSQISYLHGLIKYLKLNMCVTKFDGLEDMKTTNRIHYIFFTKIGNLIESAFKKVLGFGNFLIFNKKNKNFSFRSNVLKHDKKFKKDSKKLKKDSKKYDEKLYYEDYNYKIIKNIYDKPNEDLDIPANIEQLRQNNNIILNSIQDEQFIKDYNEINKKKEEYKKQENTILNELNDEIKKIIIDDNEKIQNKFNNIKQFKENELNEIREKIREIEVDNNKGRIYNFINGKLGLYKLEDNIYKVYLDYDDKYRKYNNPSTENKSVNASVYEKKSCKLCKLARTRNWINELNSETSISNYRGLNNNLTYYEYNDNSKIIEPVGFAFEQMYGKELNNQRILTIPYNHLPTMGHHDDCNINSKNFKPNGSFSNKLNKWNCGASVYENSKDAEVLHNMINTLKTALLFGYLRDKKKYIIGEINYSISPRFYEYKKSDDDNNPFLFITLHSKANSEPHLHMHTFYDKDNNLFKEIIDSFRLTNKNYFLDRNIKYDININNIDEMIQSMMGNLDNSDYVEESEKFNQSRQINGNINFIEELFGIKTNSKYKVFEHSYGDFLYLEGTNKLDDKKTYKYIKPKAWVDINNVSSTMYGKNNKMHFVSSFEYLFKKIIGISDDDPLMKCKFIFPEPFYNDDNIYTYNNQKDSLEDKVKTKFTELVNREYLETKSILYNIKNYKDYNKQKQNERKLIDKSNINYGNSIDEKHISRNSTTKEDNMMLLCLQFAFINNPQIGGYYGHSAPIFNKYKNITHPEICLFNTVDYMIDIVKNAKFTNCNITDTTNKYDKYILVVSMYFIKFYNQYNRKIDITDFGQIISHNIINSFFTQNLITEPELVGGEIPDKLKEIKQISDKLKEITEEKSNLKKITEQKLNIPTTDEIHICINEIIKCINTNEDNFYKFDEDDKNFIITTIKCLHLNINPTTGQSIFLNNEEFNLINSYDEEFN